MRISMDFRSRRGDSDDTIDSSTCPPIRKGNCSNLGSFVRSTKVSRVSDDDISRSEIINKNFGHCERKESFRRYTESNCSLKVSGGICKFVE